MEFNIKEIRHLWNGNLNVHSRCRKRILFCYRPNEHQLECLERELLGFKEADVNGNADKKADANEKTDAGRKADVDRKAGADKKADVNKTTDTDERKEAKKETDAEEKTLLSETDKVKLAVLEKREDSKSYSETAVRLAGMGTAKQKYL
jgi:hypothetical protein